MFISLSFTQLNGLTCDRPHLVWGKRWRKIHTMHTYYGIGECSGWMPLLHVLVRMDIVLVQYGAIWYRGKVGHSWPLDDIFHKFLLGLGNLGRELLLLTEVVYDMNQHQRFQPNALTTTQQSFRKRDYWTHCITGVCHRTLVLGKFFHES